MLLTEQPFALRHHSYAKDKPACIVGRLYPEPCPLGSDRNQGLHFLQLWPVGVKPDKAKNGVEERGDWLLSCLFVCFKTEELLAFSTHTAFKML